MALCHYSLSRNKVNTSARITYWKFTLRFITRTEVAAWADMQIEAGHGNGELFDLSTCSQLDDNVIMDLLTSLSAGYDQSAVEREFIETLIDHHSQGKAGEPVNISRLVDYSNISDISDETFNSFMWIEAQFELSKQGIAGAIANESQIIVERLSKQLK